jgi:hypothetical protein
LVARFQEPQIWVDDAFALLCEHEGDLLARQDQVQTVDAAQDAEDVHVLAPVGVGDVLQAELFQGNLGDPESLGDQFVEYLGVRRGDLRIGIAPPLAFQENVAAGFDLVGPKPCQQDLLVERHDQICLIATVCNRLGCHTNSVAAGSGDAPRGGLDFGRDDLHGPNTVPHPRRDRAEGLAASLRALAGVADDLDDMLLERHDPFAARARAALSLFAGYLSYLGHLSPFTSSSPRR